MFTKEWAKAALIRSIRTAAQTFVALLPAQSMITEVNWQVVFGTSALAAVASFATSLAGLPEVEMAEDKK